MINKKRILILLILLGLLIRLTLIFSPGFKFDIDAWFAWAERLNQVGFSQFYSNQIWTNYTPGFLYILAFLGLIKNLLHINNSLFYAILKLPSIIAEIILGIFIFHLVSKKYFYWAVSALIVMLFNPGIIFNSSIWGQIDGLLSLLMLLSIYFLYQKQLVLSSFFLGLSFLMKPQSIALFPVIGLYLMNNLSLKPIMKIVLTIFLTIVILSLPFFTNNITGLFQLFSKMFSDYPQTSLFAYNLWGIVGFWIPDIKLWNELSYQMIGSILFLIYWITISYFYFKRKLSLYAVATLALLGFYFLPTRVHERYLYPAIIFLILLSSLSKSRILFLLTIFLSLIHFLNLYYVYVYYNEIYLKLPKLFYNPIIYSFLDNNGKILSLISTVIFLMISITILKSNEHLKKI